MRDEIKNNNSKIIADALLKGKAKFVWLTDVTGRPVKVLTESLHKNETIFINAGNEVDYNPNRHKTTSPPFKGGERGVVL